MAKEEHTQWAVVAVFAFSLGVAAILLVAYAARDWWRNMR
jgi:hypothetical protein